MNAGMVAVVGGSSGTTNPVLVDAWRADGIDARATTAREAVALLSPGDTALVRIDVRTTLDGLEPGLLAGVDLLPAGDGYRVVEVNGAVDFQPSYALSEEGVHRSIAVALGLRSTTWGDDRRPARAYVQA